MVRFLKMLAGLALLPGCWAVSAAVYTLYGTSVDTGSAAGWEAWALPIGFAAWVATYFLLPRPVRAYVLGHELTHALWALMMGARIGRMKIGRTGGHVMLSKSNFLITLAPYFFPFYTFLVIAAYYLAGLWIDVEGSRAWWLVAVGATWSFHITFTLGMLAQHQPDVKEHGRIFSYTVIYIANVLAIGCWLVAVGSPRLASFADLLGTEGTMAYSFAGHQAALAWAWIAKWGAGMR